MGPHARRDGSGRRLYLRVRSRGRPGYAPPRRLDAGRRGGGHCALATALHPCSYASPRAISGGANVCAGARRPLATGLGREDQRKVLHHHPDAQPQGVWTGGVLHDFHVHGGRRSPPRSPRGRGVLRPRLSTGSGPPSRRCAWCLPVSLSGQRQQASSLPQRSRSHGRRPGNLGGVSRSATACRLVQLCHQPRGAPAFRGCAGHVCTPAPGRPCSRHGHRRLLPTQFAGCRPRTSYVRLEDRWSHLQVLWPELAGSRSGHSRGFGGC
mmetsp:Transcript_10317/g.20651  ORF Transcript_10317/g.20651 Transcript_10317/m.20651 type:complete len:267 (+) Transcript_10317:1391-2191(+)